MKFRIINERHSDQIQTELFKLGYGWAGLGGCTISFSKMCYLYTYRNGAQILFGSIDDFCDKHENIESTLEDLIKMNQGDN